MSKYPVPRDFTVESRASLHVLTNFAFPCLSVKYRALLRVCASQRSDYGNGNSSGAVWPCRLMADRLLDTFFTVHGQRRLNLSCFLLKIHHGYVFDILIEKSDQSLYLIK
jgi:hypothetical protein